MKEIIYELFNSPLKYLGGEFKHPVLISDDKVVFGIFMLLLAFLFYTNDLPKYKKIYKYVPVLVLCYFIPALLSTFHIIPSGSDTSLYSGFSKVYLLPGALVLLTLGIDFQGLRKLGTKAIAMFFTGTIGVIIGGPIAILVVSLISPETFQATETTEEAWRGLSTLAGSWIGGGANQAAMLETYGYKEALYGRMVTVDIAISGIWMSVLLYLISRHKEIDRWLKADDSAVVALKNRIKDYESKNSRIATTKDYMIIGGIAFGAVGLAHYLSTPISTFFYDRFGESNPLGSSFLWVIVFTTTFGLILSTTKLRQYEGAGASKIGSVFIYILVLTIGMKMDLTEIFKQPMLLLVGLIWMVIHVGIMFLVAKLIKAPFFFLAVGSKANIGGAATAPVVAGAFDPSLSSVGALLAILGYAVGTYGAIACAELMHLVS